MTSENSRTYDVVVLGAGPVGENVADRTSAAGLRTVIVEAELVGGECSYWAREPSKALLRPALLHAEASRVPGVAAPSRPLRGGGTPVTEVAGISAQSCDATEIPLRNRGGTR